MPDTRNIKTINSEDARTALVDAIADLLHIHDGDEATVGELEHEAWKSARHHYECELVEMKEGTLTIQRQFTDEERAERYFNLVDQMEEEWKPYTEAIKALGREGALDQTGGMVFCLRVDLANGSYLYAGTDGGVPTERCELGEGVEDGNRDPIPWSWGYYEKDGEWGERYGTLFKGDEPEQLARALDEVAKAIESGGRHHSEDSPAEVSA